MDKWVHSNGISRSFSHVWRWSKALPKNIFAMLVEFAKSAKQIGKDDPRRVIHSIKVGLALSLVSLFYYSQPLYDGFGVSAMWAVMTVVVVFEFSVGATIGKGLNRVLATLLACVLGVGAHHLASISGKIGEPILIGLFVFILAATSTFIRFFPKVKARYDYGLLIFILTFCLVSVSSFRNDEILDLSHKRLTTVVIGIFTCVIISISICPVWAGEELHNQVAANIEMLGNFLEGFGNEYFKRAKAEEGKEDKSFLKAYKAILNSKSSEESMCNFARWEPSHGPFKYCHPWKQYLKIGKQTRECAYLIEAINSYLSPKVAPEMCTNFKETCIEMNLECGKALKELASSIKTMSTPCTANPHIANSKSAANNLQSLLKSSIWDSKNLFEVVPVVTVVSLLTEILTCTEKVYKLVHELAVIAQFKSCCLVTNPCSSLELQLKADSSHIVVAVNGPTADCLRIRNSC